MIKCSALTLKGDGCKKKAKKGSNYCSTHILGINKKDNVKINDKPKKIIKNNNYNLDNLNDYSISIGKFNDYSEKQNNNVLFKSSIADPPVRDSLINKNNSLIISESINSSIKKEIEDDQTEDPEPTENESRCECCFSIYNKELMIKCTKSNKGTQSNKKITLKNRRITKIRIWTKWIK